MADLDSDGDKDVIAAIEDDGEIIIFKNNGQGDFGSKIVINNDVQNAISLNFGDVDGDNDIDIFYTNFIEGTSFWNENDGNGNFGQSKQIGNVFNNPLNLQIGDFENNGLQDFIVAEFDKITMVSNNGNNEFNMLNVIDSSFVQCRFVSLWDVDEDGDQDIIANINGELTYYENSIISSTILPIITDYIKILPNPAYDYLTIDTELKNYSYSIIDIFGRVIKLPNESNRIDISQLPLGSYYLVFRLNNQFVSKNFFKI